ncbi:MAG: hypothetical protein ACE366_09600 [Bradymonadia bacterium]
MHAHHERGHLMRTDPEAEQLARERRAHQLRETAPYLVAGCALLLSIVNALLYDVLVIVFFGVLPLFAAWVMKHATEFGARFNILDRMGHSALRRRIQLICLWGFIILAVVGHLAGLVCWMLGIDFGAVLTSIIDFILPSS